MSASSSLPGEAPRALEQIAKLGDLRFHHRVGTVDEVILGAEYQVHRIGIPDASTLINSVVIDAGAHIGVSAAVIAHRIPSAKVVALEPERMNFRLLAENVALNNLSNVECRQIGLAGCAGNATLHHSEENWGHSLIAEMAGSVVSEPVAVTTLAALVDEFGTIGFVKMNIEGAEYDVLLSSTASVLRHVANLLVEIHPVVGRSGEEVLQHLRRAGYQVQVEWDRGEAGKGWVAARR